MFGQKPFGQTFGQQTSSAFGGQSSFAAGNTSFGGAGGFGTQTPSSGGMFGTTTTASTPATGLFGGSSQPGFGQTATQGTGYAFGQTATQGAASGGTSLFGGSGQSTSLFGTPTTSSAFGAKTPGGFGTTAAPSAGLFGNTSTGGSSLFGTTATAAPAAAGLFPASTTGFGAGGQTGTTIKFNPPADTDTMVKQGVTQNVNTRQMCITAMKEYESKSMEELRLEDYLANRKGPQQGAAGLFNPQTTQTAAFGGFNQTKTPSFTGFGGTQGGLFGQQPQQQQQQGTSLFGSTAVSKPLFGTTTTATTTAGFGGFGATSTSGSLFGQNNAQKSLFGQPATTQASGLFSGTQTSTAGFGTSTGFATPGFGVTTQAGGLFGTKPVGFGQPTVSSGIGFGQQQGTTGGLFSKPATTFGFGTQTSTAGFGTQATSGSLFGKPLGFGAGTSLGTPGFGAGAGIGTGLNTGTNMFSGQQAKPTLGIGTGFGTGTGVGGFGLGTAGTGLSLGGTQTGLGLTNEANDALAQQAQIQQQLMALANCPYGDSPLFRNTTLEGTKIEERVKPTNPAAQKAVLNASSQYKVSPRPTAKIKPKPLHTIVNGKAKLFEGLEDDDSTFGNDSFVPRKSVKKLIIKPNNNASSVGNGSVGQLLNNDDVITQPLTVAEGSSEVPSEDLGSPRTTNKDTSLLLQKRYNARINEEVTGNVHINEPNHSRRLDDTIAELNAKNRRMGALDTSHESTPIESVEEPDLESEGSEISQTPHPAGIVLRRSGYFTIPSLKELEEMVDDNGDCVVENFVVGREGYGNVFFPGIVNVAGLNLDEIVHFRRKEITVYPDDDIKPVLGEGLNRKAQVTLDCVWPADKSDHTPIKSPWRLGEMNYQEKLERASLKIGAKFIDYRPETGSWVFEVQHFSKYGLLDDSDDDNPPDPNDPKQVQKLKEQQQKQLAIQKQEIKTVAQEAGKAAQRADAQKVISESNQEDVAREQSREQVAEQPPARVGLGGVASIPDPMQEEDTDMPDIMHEQFPDEGSTQIEVENNYMASSHRLATSLGVRAENLQLQKASFFGSEDMDIEDKDDFQSTSYYSNNQPTSSVFSNLAEIQLDSYKQIAARAKSPPEQRFTQSQRSFINQPLSMLSGPKFKAARKSASSPVYLPSGMPPVTKPRKVVGTRIRRTVPALQETQLCDKTTLIMDTGLTRNRAFRVGWGPNWTLAHLGKPLMQQQAEREPQKGDPFILLPSAQAAIKKYQETVSHCLTIESISSTDSNLPDSSVVNEAEQWLTVQLKHSETSIEGGCPLFVPTSGVESLLQYSIIAEQAKDSIDKVSLEQSGFLDEASLVWDLAMALWGDLPPMPQLQGEMNEYTIYMARRETLSQWLSAAAVPKIKQELENLKGEFMIDSGISGVFSLLTGRQISEACQESQNNGEQRLALLMSQTGGGDVLRRMVERQLSNWEESQVDEFICRERLQIYSLLAGRMVWHGASKTVNVCENMDWKRCLAQHLWYHCSPSASIADALAQYEAAFKGTTQYGKYAAPPLPPYLEDSGLSVCGEDIDRSNWDMCYHLIKLYTDRSHPLNVLLTPATATSDPLDFRLSWHLCQVLQALDFTGVSECHALTLCVSYAAQLESIGLWQWAVFVLLHIKNTQQRGKLVRDLLIRHVGLETDPESKEKEEFLEDRLNIPYEWIHEAKAIKSRVEGRPQEEAWHLLQAGRWSECHQVILRELAHVAIINERYEILKKYLSVLSCPDHCVGIPNWKKGGKVYLDFISMMQTLQQLKQGEPSAYELEGLQSEVSSLANKIDSLDCPTSKHRLCQSEMAKQTTNLMRTLMTMQNPDTHLSAKLLAPKLCGLPMPEDYALQELRQLTRSYMLEATMS